MRDMHRALAQARNDVQDTPAPVMKTDPAMPAVVLGIDALDGRADRRVGRRAAVPVRAPQDSSGVRGVPAGAAPGVCSRW
jgi:hypothetical protein